MNVKALRWLYQELPGLVAKGVLAEETAAKIKEHYGELRGAGKTSVAKIVCAVTGALLIGLGIISLLAHNWEQFSRPVRTIISLGPLVIGQALGLWVLVKRPESNPLKESVASFISLMVGASIALVSQTYNIPGDVNTFVLTWMLLILPLVYLMQASLPAAIYLIGITAWSASHWDNPARGILFWPLAALIAPHFIWSLRREIYAIRSTILSLVITICVSVAASVTLGKTWPGSWVIILPSTYAVFYLIGQRRFASLTSNWQRPMRLIGGIGLFVLAFQFTFRYAWRYLESESYGRALSVNALADHLITFIIVASAIVLFFDNARRGELMPSLFGVLPLAAIVGYSLAALSIAPLIFNIYLFALSVSCILGGLENNRLSVVNTGMLMLAILIVARFFDSDINFIIKGLVFIAVGIGFLSVNLSLIRRREGAQ